jgi:hypothetical protein
MSARTQGCTSGSLQHAGQRDGMRRLSTPEFKARGSPFDSINSSQGHRDLSRRHYSRWDFQLSFQGLVTACGS